MKGFGEGVDAAVVEAAETVLDAFKVEQAVMVVATFVGRSVAELDAVEADRLWGPRVTRSSTCAGSARATTIRF